MEREIVINRDGLKLKGLINEIEGSDHIVIIMHGFTANIHSAFLDKLVNELEANKISSIRVNFNGHGNSDGSFINMNVLNEIEDGIKILEYVQSLSYCKISLFGHSQGGVVASMLAGYYHDAINKLVLAAPAATLKDDALKGVCMSASYNPNNIPEYVDIYSHNVTNRVGGHYFRIAQALPIYEVAKQFKGSVCLIHGTNDIVVDKIASERYHNVYKDSKLNLIDGDNHGFELYTDKLMEIVIAFII